MRRSELLVIGCAIAGVTATSYASETISYHYDARGRLVKVLHNGSANNNITANYSYDKADNRTNVNVIGAPK